MVIPGRVEDANYDVPLHIGESMTTIGRMDSGFSLRENPERRR
jgi:hypothetical protein